MVERTAAAVAQVVAALVVAAGARQFSCIVEW
jgi:hypothetical protein